MPSFKRAAINEIVLERPGLQRVSTTEGRAYVLSDLTGPVEVGDEVILNTTAVELGLGTGGWHVVHWNLAHDEWSQAGPGHIMKMRYTSLQADTGAAEELHPDIDGDLAGMPVVVAGLHSQVAGIVVAAKHLRPDARVAYVMTDGAALPIVISDLVADLTAAGLLAGTITAGHAFGGDLEAVTVASALGLARHVLAADLCIVAMGPGVVGTGTSLGTTAIEVAALADIAARLGGQSVVCLRVSGADPRERHRGISHHTLTALSLAHGPLVVGVTGEDRHAQRSALEAVAEPGSVSIEDVDPPDVGALLAEQGLKVTTMGRGPAEEPEFFAACGVAAALAIDRIDKQSIVPGTRRARP